MSPLSAASIRRQIPKVLVPLFILAIAGRAEKVLILQSTPTPPRVDGVIDAVWERADSVWDFEQFTPFYGKPPSERTCAKLMATNTALYGLIVCYHAQSPMENIAGVHDQASGDAVSLMIDTFNDDRTAYKFAVSAAGVLYDARLIDDGRNRDNAWDGVWFGDAQVYPWGFVVEIEIPFKSIRYNGELKEWGLDFDRWVATTKEDLYWCRYEQAEGQRISKFGSLVLNGARPVVEGLNLEVYPVAFAKAEEEGNKTYRVEPDAGIDIFYNPSEQLTFQLTGNPDFAQIEADPYEFNISRYETYFDERRPFFTTGNEVFMAAGRERNSGFYRPLELFYSRRIGRLVGEGDLVPLNVGAKTFGRLGSWEYGAFIARTGSVNYDDEGELVHESAAVFTSARVKKQIFDNSTVGMLFVGKHTPEGLDGVIDIDGAFRNPSYQLAYQLARSLNKGKGDFGGSAGFRMFTKDYGILIRSRVIGNDFDVDQVGFVPWKGTANLTAIGGPMWYFDTGAIRSMFQYSGFFVDYEHEDLYTDWGGAVGLNVQFRSDWGFETTFQMSKSKDNGVPYIGWEFNHSMWFSISPRWHANVWGGYAHLYNFSREYLGDYTWLGSYAEWKVLDVLEIGTTYDMYVEVKPDGGVEDITYNARPFFSFTPVNNLNLRVYIDDVFLRSSDQNERVIVGFLFSYNFLPKSWIYLALNEVQERQDIMDPVTGREQRKMAVTGRAAVLKVKYLYYL